MDVSSSVGTSILRGITTAKLSETARSILAEQRNSNFVSFPFRTLFRCGFTWGEKTMIVESASYLALPKKPAPQFRLNTPMSRLTMKHNGHSKTDENSTADDFGVENRNKLPLPRWVTEPGRNFSPTKRNCATMSLSASEHDHRKSRTNMRVDVSPLSSFPTLHLSLFNYADDLWRPHAGGWWISSNGLLVIRSAS